MKEIIRNQMLAALSTLNQCLLSCPDNEWQETHHDAPFSQVLFHTLFYTDYYLSSDEGEFKSQDFHKKNKTLFRDYEELEYKQAEQIYIKEEIRAYLDFCQDKTNEYFNKTEDGNLSKKSKLRDMTVAELLIDNTRHIQHHAAQLGLRIQQITAKELKWISSGWKEA
jgi:hypothetical protein